MGNEMIFICVLFVLFIGLAFIYFDGSAKAQSQISGIQTQVSTLDEKNVKMLQLIGAAQEEARSKATKQEILDSFNACKFYGVRLSGGKSCNDICADPRQFGSSEATGQTCVLAEFSANDQTGYARTLTRCTFSDAGRNVTCVCCK